MTNQYIQPDELWPSAQYGFSQVVVSTGTKIIHCAGQTAWDKDKNFSRRGRPGTTDSPGTGEHTIRPGRRGRYHERRGAPGYLRGGLQSR